MRTIERASAFKRDYPQFNALIKRVQNAHQTLDAETPQLHIANIHNIGMGDAGNFASRPRGELALVQYANDHCG